MKIINTDCQEHKTSKPNQVGCNCEQRFAKFTKAFEFVIERLPAPVAKKLHRFWKQCKGTDIVTGESFAGPVSLICTGWNKMTTQANGAGSLGFSTDSASFVFDGEFIETAPREAIESLIAYQIAVAYLDLSKVESSPNKIARLMEQWGFWMDDEEVWEAARTESKNPVDTFYAFRLAQLGRPLPSHANRPAVESVLREKGVELAKV